jgi:hypothetical protein
MTSMRETLNWAAYVCGLALVVEQLLTLTLG